MTNHESATRRQAQSGDDVLIIGAGVIGLSLAYELSGSGARVRVVDRQTSGREASWAGAGILPPANRTTAEHPYDQLRGLSAELHPEWSARLLDETEIHNGFERCGGIYVARSVGEAAALRGMVGVWQDEGLEAETVDSDRLAELEPGLAHLAREPRPRLVVSLPGECQIRNPRHLKALRRALEQRGVVVEDNNEVVRFKSRGSRILAAETRQGERHAAKYCVASGAWSGGLLKALGVEIGVLPIRGQMLLFKLASRPFVPVINEGPRYLVPREDGFVLAGSTEEEEGFSKQTTTQGLDDLTRFAVSLIPALSPEKQVRAWAGLRPGSFDGFPYLGQLPEFENGFVAAGHFRSGLYLSPATARVMAALLQDEKPEIDLEPFSVLRHPLPSRR